MEHDVVVVGSGAGALAGAFTAAAEGLSTIVLEKADVCGGTTAYSGGNFWLPGNPYAVGAGKPDSPERGRTFLRALLGDTDLERREAFLTTAPRLLPYLEAKHPALVFQFEPMPEYYEAEGRLPGGNQVGPLPLPAEEISPELLALVRRSIGPDRWDTDAPRDVLHGGQSLIARLLMAFVGVGGEVRTGTAVDRLVVEDGRVVGVEAQTADGRVTVRARHGVLLASGGFERNQELRERFGVPGRAVHSMAPRESNAGEVLLAGIEAGAATAHLQEAWFCPALLEPDGSAGFLIGFRGGVIVDAKGRRFANECLPYDRFGREMAKSAPEAWYVFDSREGARVPAIRCVPGARREDYLAAGAWVTAETVAELADLMGVPADELEQTVDRWNGFADKGVDEEFHRGEDEFDLRFVFPNDQPNPALVPMRQGPFFAAKVVLGDLGTKGGLLTGPDGEVVREDGSVIGGLYAAGNTMASITGPVYPAPGAPIGTAMVFGHRAARAMAQSPSA